MTMNTETLQLIASGAMGAKHVALLMQADMLAEESALDTLQMARVATIIGQAQDILLKGDPEEREQLKQLHPQEPVGMAEMGIELVKQLYPERYADGKEFRHKGCRYYVEQKTTPILQDAEGKPLQGKDFANIYRIDERKRELARKQAELTRTRKEAITKLMEKHPYLQLDVKRTLHVIK